MSWSLIGAQTKLATKSTWPIKLYENELVLRPLRFRDKRAWDITVKNKKKQEINLVLQDRFPIPQNNEITVDNVDVAGSDFNKDTGILTWRMKLATGEEKKVSPKYSVKYPKGRVVYLE